jgi:hypothetical protein
LFNSGNEKQKSDAGEQSYALPRRVVSNDVSSGVAGASVKRRWQSFEKHQNLESAEMHHIVSPIERFGYDHEQYS